MATQKTKHTGLLLLGAVAILFGAVAYGADVPQAPGDRAAVRVGPEKSVNGITVEQFYAQQKRLHGWLMGKTPAGTLKATTRADLTAQDLDNIANQPKGLRPTPLRIGVVKTIRPIAVNGVDSPQSKSVYEQSDDGSFTWATTISSTSAEGIRVHFANFSLPAGAEMYIFNQEGDARGPYVDQGLNGDGEFWSHTVFSDTALILLSHPGAATAQDRAGVTFKIDQVGVIRPHRPFAIPHAEWSDNQCDNASCVLDANCGSVAPADQSAIAKLEWIAGAYIITCTGGLIADTDGSTQRNLLLTANHCIGKSKDAKNLETYFFYTTSGCNGTCPEWPSTPSTIGSSILATGRDGDFSLLELNQDPPSGTTFLGWNNSEIAFTGGADLYRVSNPNYGPQVYSHHEVDAETSTCQGMPRGEFIYSVDVEGAVDGGSSGAPVVNSSGEIVGQLYGCCGYNCGDVCDSGSNNTTDGALAFYYADVAPFLDVGCDPSPEVCNNGVDDDCDDAVDCADPDCSGDPACDCIPEPEICTDEIDNDCDTAVDCDDPDCATDPACACGQTGDPCTSNADCCTSCNKKTGTCR